MTYNDYLKTDDWKEKRRRKLAKKHTCGICGNPKVDIHHLNYRDLFNVQQSDLRRMCRRCHFLAHDLHRAGKIVFTSTNNNSRWMLIKNAVKRELGIFHVPMRELRNQLVSS